MTSNIRAAERFLGSLKGVGSIMQAAFPLVGGIALLGVMSEMIGKADKLREAYLKVKDAPNQLAAGFQGLNQSLALTNAKLQVQSDALQKEIDNLNGKPHNGLKDALDESIASSRELSESLRKNFDDLQKVVEGKGVGFWGGLVTGQASTSDIDDKIQAYRTQYGKIETNATAGISAVGDPRAVGAAEKIAAIEKQKTADESALLAQVRTYSLDVINAAKKAEADAKGRADERDINDVPIRRDPATQGARISEASGLLENVNDLITNRSILATIQAQKSTVSGLKDVDRSGADKRAELDRQSVQDLQRAATQVYGGVTHATEDFVRKMDELNKSGVASLKAVMNTRGAYTLQLAGEIRAGVKKDQNTNVEQSNKGFSDNVNDQLKNAASANTYDSHVAEISDAQNDKSLEYAQQSINQERDLRISALDALNAKTAQKKLQVEAAKFEIEKEYIEKSQDLQFMRIDADAEKAKAKEEETATELLAKVGSDQAAIDKIKSDLAAVSRLIDQNAQRAKAALDSANAAKIQVGQNTLGSQMEKVPQTASDGVRDFFRDFQAQTLTTGQMVEKSLGGAFQGLNQQLTALVTGQKTSWSSFFRSIAAEFAQFALQIAESSLMKQLASGLTGAAGGGGFLAKLFGGFKASGGDVDPGHGYVVGENGPEFFSPGTSGSIIPNHALRSSAGATYVIDARGTNAADVEARVQRALVAVHGSAVQSAVGVQDEMNRRKPKFS